MTLGYDEEMFMMAALKDDQIYAKILSWIGSMFGGFSVTLFFSAELFLFLK